MATTIIPPYLQPGALIGICSTARKVSAEEVAPMVFALQKEGFEVLLPPDLYADQNQFAGSDEMRARCFQSLLDNPKVEAILFARGGYGTVRIIDSIDWTGFQHQPKWLCGFSDVTVTHAHVQRNFEVATLHCDMIPQFLKKGADHEAFQSMIDALKGRAHALSAPNFGLNRPGFAKGKLVGGNLSILYSVLGSASDADTAGCILLIEDLDEYFYHLDRMLMNLKRNGKLSHLAGLVVGGMNDMHDNPVPFGQTAEQIIRSHVDEFSFPVAFNMPSGHIDMNIAVALGAEYNLDVGPPGGILSPT